MPLSEVYSMAKGRLDSAQDKNTLDGISFVVPENDLVDRVWENGQIMVQGQTSKARKNPKSICLPFHDPTYRTTDIEDGSNSKSGKFGTMDSVLNEAPFSVPAGEMELNQDDNMVPWLSFRINGSLRHSYGSDFFPKVSEVTVNEFFSQDDTPLVDKRYAYSHSHKNLNTNFLHNYIHQQEGHVPKVSSAGDDETRPNKCSMQSYLFSQCQKSVQASTSRSPDSIDNSMNNFPHIAISRESIEIPTREGEFCSIKLQKQSPEPPRNSSNFINFAHFAQSATLLQANLRNSSTVGSSAISSAEKIGCQNKGSADSNSIPAESTLVKSTCGLRKEIGSHCQPIMTPSKTDSKPLKPKTNGESLAANASDAAREEDALTNRKNSTENQGGNSSQGLPDGEKTTEPAVASSSVCSGNSVDKASDDPKQNSKRKCHDTEESECPNEDFETQSAGAKKAAHTRASTGSKRSRAAEVHNLSERRRRDRINEKMRALQELIPNCNKVDKASMLDEAIEYLKTLQLQVQIMSMEIGLCMPSVMLPTGMQQMHPAQVAQFASTGVGVGMGFGRGMPDMNGGCSEYPLIQIPSMQGEHYAGSPVAGPAFFHGMEGSNLKMLGHADHWKPMSMPRETFIPLPGGLHTKSEVGLDADSRTGHMENLGSTSASSGKDLTLNINSQVMQKIGANSSVNQTSDRVQ